MIESDIHHFATETKEFSGECFDFDRLSTFCLGGVVLRGCFSFTERFSILWIQHQAVFSKDLPGEFCQLQGLFFAPKSPTEILEFESQRRLPSELAGFAFMEPEKSSLVPHSFDLT